MATEKTKEAPEMFRYYDVVLEMEGEFGASIPKTREEILKMLENRMPTNKPDDAVEIGELADQVAEAVAVEDGEEEKALPGAATFLSDENGLYYEGRCVRGHLKDCALQAQGFMYARNALVKNFRAKFANSVYVVDQKIYMDKREVEGTQQRFIQVMTRQGPRSSIKYVDYVLAPTLSFTLKVLNNNVILEDHIRKVFEYGGTHGMGAERSQSWGRYQLVSLELRK
jgi:hypothetical protein